MFLGQYVPMQSEVMHAMFDIAKFKVGDTHIELGAGNGQFVEEGVIRGLNSIGYESDETLANDCIARGLNVVHGDFFDYDLSDADLITFWFCDRQDGDIQLLIQKLATELKNNCEIVALFDSRVSYRNGVLIPELNGVPQHPNFAPIKSETVLGDRFYYYKR